MYRYFLIFVVLSSISSTGISSTQKIQDYFPRKELGLSHDITHVHPHGFSYHDTVREPFKGSTYRFRGNKIPKNVPQTPACTSDYNTIRADYGILQYYLDSRYALVLFRVSDTVYFVVFRISADGDWRLRGDIPCEVISHHMPLPGETRWKESWLYDIDGDGYLDIVSRNEYNHLHRRITLTRYLWRSDHFSKKEFVIFDDRDKSKRIDLKLDETAVPATFANIPGFEAADEGASARKKMRHWIVFSTDRSLDSALFELRRARKTLSPEVSFVLSFPSQLFVQKKKGLYLSYYEVTGRRTAELGLMEVREHLQQEAFLTTADEFCLDATGTDQCEYPGSYDGISLTPLPK